MKEWERIEKNGFIFELEPLRPDASFSSSKGRKRWKELKEELISEILKYEDELKKLEIKRIQIASIGYFYLKGITQGRFIPLTTMHIARLLKR